MAIRKKHRDALLSNVIKVFDHGDAVRHDKEIEMGAVSALFQKVLLIQAISESKKDKYIEINIVCSAIEMDYRC